MDLVISTLSVALGIAVTAEPERAARVWGWKDLDRLTPSSRCWYLRTYRIFGVLLSIAGIMVAVERVFVRRA